MYWLCRHIKQRYHIISQDDGFIYQMGGKTVSNILYYFSAAKRIEFLNIKIYNPEEFAINEANYNINEIWFQSCLGSRHISNEKIFDLIDKIVSHKCIHTSLKQIAFNSMAYIPYQKWESTHEKLDLLGISLIMNDIEFGFQAYKDEAIHLELKNKEYVKNMNLDETNSLKSYEAIKLYIQLHQSLLQLWIKGYYYNYVISVLDSVDSNQFHNYESSLYTSPTVEK